MMTVFDPDGGVFLAGISLTHLTVYDAVSPDDQAGGSPHVHLACSEAYFVLGGTGAVELITAGDGFRRLELAAGSVVHLEPGAIHRLVNDDHLEILVLMQNAGLPEHGDAVFTFPPADLADPDVYARNARVQSIDDAIARRDRAIAGFLDLAQGFASSLDEGRRLLEQFHRAAVRLVEGKVPAWREIVRQGPEASVAETIARLDALAAGRLPDLDRARVSEPGRGEERLGMCGRLHPVLTTAAPRIGASAGRAG